MILGAWGCGVFCNNLNDIANYFAHFLINEGKYSKCFDNIIFAVYSTEKKREISHTLKLYSDKCNSSCAFRRVFYFKKKDNKIYTS